MNAPARIALPQALTARELAAMKLPDMPANHTAIWRRAQGEGWVGQVRQRRGGGTEFTVDELAHRLPQRAYNALLKRLGTAPEAPPATTANDLVAGQQRDPSALAKWQRACADARAAILTQLDEWAAVMGREKAARRMEGAAATGTLPAELLPLVPTANARAGKDGGRTLSARSLYRWHASRAASGWWGLVPEDAGRAEKPMPAWGAPLLKLYRVPTKRSLMAVLEDLPAHLPEGVRMPSYDEARRLLAKMAPVDRNKGRMGPLALLALKGHKRRDTSHLLPLDVVTADGTSYKADVAHPIHGQRFRPEVVTIIDAATRYCFGHSAGLAESSHLVMDAIRHGVSKLGFFHIFYTDNGSGFIADAITHEVTGLFGRIGATPLTAMPGRAQARGKIERPQASLHKRAARKLLTYTGRDMDREAKRRIDKLIDADFKAAGSSARLISWVDFLAFLEAEIAAYNNRPHRGLPKTRDDVTGKSRHMSPAEMLQHFIDQGWEPRLCPEDVMRDLFRPHVERTVARGEVKLPWGRYFHPRLVQFHGDKVLVAYEHHDASRVWVRTLPDERLICIAEKDANVVPEQPQSAIEHARLHSAKSKMKIVQRRADLIQAEANPGLFIEHEPAPMSPEQEAHHATMLAEFEAGTIAIAAPANDPRDDDEPEDRQRFRRALAIYRAAEAGEAVSADDTEWLRIYQAGDEWRSLFLMYQDFGDMLFA